MRESKRSDYVLFIFFTDIHNLWDTKYRWALFYNKKNLEKKWFFNFLEIKHLSSLLTSTLKLITSIGKSQSQFQREKNKKPKI